MILKAPFPWFGGKSRAAEIVWPRLGNVPNYVEPFAGSLAMLLSRPHKPHTETVNDLDCYLANFWRAIKAAPDATAEAADWPVNEADLLARHRWLLNQEGFRERMRADPEYFDAKIAGWWVWGLCSWIGSGWCVDKAADQLPHLGNAGRGIHKKLPHLGDAGRGIAGWFEMLSERLRRVRVACGDWDRVLGESVTFKHGPTAVFLDPPYDADLHDVTYSADTNCSAAVRKWALENGKNKLLRIAICGYGAEHDELLKHGWDKETWKARKGYQTVDEDGKSGSEQERIWFSPHCLSDSLFGMEAS